MRKICSSLLLAMLVIPLASGANVTCDLKWEFPGSVKVYVGGCSEAYRVEVPADATSFHVDYENSFGTVYVKPAPGYFVDSAVCSDSNHAKPVTIFINEWTGGVSINLNDNTNYHNGHEVWVNISTLVYDKELTIDMLSTGNVTAKFQETGREVSVKMERKLSPTLPRMRKQ